MNFPFNFTESNLAILFAVIGVIVMVPVPLLILRATIKNAKANYEKLKVELEAIAKEFGLTLSNTIEEKIQEKEKQHSEGGATKKSAFVEGLQTLAMQQAWKLEGMYAGVKVFVNPVQIREGSGRRRHDVTYTRFQAFFSQPLGVGLKIYKEGFMSRVGKVLGASDMQTGNPDFDKKFMIKGTTDSRLVSRLSSPDTQQAIEALFDLNPDHLDIGDEGIVMDWRGVVKDHEVYRNSLTLMGKVIKGLS